MGTEELANESSLKNLMPSLVFTADLMAVPDPLFQTSSHCLEKKFEKPNSCAYICNQLASQENSGNMRRDIFEAIAGPPGRVFIILIAWQATITEAGADHFTTTSIYLSDRSKRTVTDSGDA